MSHVANVILNYTYGHSYDAECLVDVNAHLAREHGTGLKPMIHGDEHDDLHWGGNKNPEVVLYAGAFNYLDDEELLDVIASQPWTYPDEIQVLIQDQNDMRFVVYNLNSAHEWSTYQ